MILPGLLEKDFTKLVTIIAQLDKYSSLLHIDIADGKLVDGETFPEYQLINTLTTHANIELHLMLEDPLTVLKDLKLKNIKRVIAHIESNNIEEFMRVAKMQGYQVGLAINPTTDLEALFLLVNQADFVQFMTVVPGGQARKFEEQVLEKVFACKKNFPALSIQVDGGISAANMEKVLSYQVDNLVVGSDITQNVDPVGNYIKLIKYEESIRRNGSISTIVATHEEIYHSKKIKKVAFLGGASYLEKDQPYKDAFVVAKALAEQGYEVINGGGPGVMRASTLGAKAAGQRVLVVTYHPAYKHKHYEGIDPENTYDEEILTVDYFDRTKVMLQNTDLHIIFKGGTGTISEFGMSWASSRIHEGHHKPIILYGEFWREIIACIKKNMLMRPGELELLTVCTTPKEVISFVENYNGPKNPLV